MVKDFKFLAHQLQYLFQQHFGGIHMNFLGYSIIASALLSISLGLLGANYEKPAHKDVKQQEVAENI